ncbi:hypothetical protein CRM22_007057 [Opisthorchis felineus]|uniref:Uncharacterized protein n=1 Tax=Opisthorchis felineus TaxID=147828 RepID=A0A4S2LQX6_OPIFE|nr:hypothetical protein CRM22_007057 [Opisthorchis felineus]
MTSMLPFFVLNPDRLSLPPINPSRFSPLSSFILLARTTTTARLYSQPRCHHISHFKHFDAHHFWNYHDKSVLPHVAGAFIIVLAVGFLSLCSFSFIQDR